MGTSRTLYNDDKATALFPQIYPSKEECEKLGFQFNETSGASLLHGLVLPLGWSIQKSNLCFFKTIVDDKGRERGTIYNSSVFADGEEKMILSLKYSVREMVTLNDSNSTTFLVYFGSNDEILFTAGTCVMPKTVGNEGLQQWKKEKKELHELATMFADENYPNWRDFGAYWDRDMSLTQKQENI